MVPWCLFFFRFFEIWRPIYLYINNYIYIYLYIYIIIYTYIYSMTGFQFPSHVTIYAGDEGQALGGSYMAFHFQSDLSPCLKNAGVSRFLITTIPSSYYASR